MPNKELFFFGLPKECEFLMESYQNEKNNILFIYLKYFGKNFNFQKQLAK
jgi:hypothetical protein